MINSVIGTLLVLTGLFPFWNGREYAGAHIHSDVEGGAFRGVYDPELSVRSGIGAEAVAFKKGVLLHGRFDYGYDYGTGSRWRGWIDPYETPFMLCDSIPGNISKETYDREATLAVPLGKWTVGAGAGYRASIFAKNKDLRNKNTRMDVSIAPSVTYRGDRFRAGLTAGYFRNTEQVEYMQVDASSEKYLFRIYGMWLYSSSGFSSAENRRYKENSGVFSDLRLEYETGPVLLRNDFHVRYTYGSQTETGYNNLHYGDTQLLSYADEFSLRAGAHRLTAFWNTAQTIGLKSLQRQELDPDSKIRRWYTYGDLSECYYRQTTHAGGAYTFEKEKWSVSAGIAWMEEKQYYREYPALLTQKLSLLEPHLGGSLRLSPGKKAGWLDLEASAHGHLPLVAVCNDITLLGTVASDDINAQLEGPLVEEFAWRSAYSTGGSLDARWTLPLPKGGRSLEFGIGVRYDAAIGGALNGRFRSGGSLSVNYNF